MIDEPTEVPPQKEVSQAVRRMTSEMRWIIEAEPSMNGISANPIEDDLMHWQAVLIGPESSPYAGGLFKLDMTFPPEYPFRPPVVKFLTPIYHCNITDVATSDGLVVLDVLRDQWSPAWKVGTVSVVFVFHSF